MGTYPEVVRALRESIASYRSGELPLESFQASVWDAASLIVDVEEHEERSFLQSAESRLELIAFTTDRDRIFDATLVVVGEIDAWAEGYLSA